MGRPPRLDAFLFGRERELRVIEEQLDSVSDGGSALLIRGEAGVGKTAILEDAKLRAARRRMPLLAATGVLSETNLPFAGLYELLRPIIDRTERLPGPQQDALRAAFGLADVPAAEPSRLEVKLSLRWVSRARRVATRMRLAPKPVSPAFRGILQAH